MFISPISFHILSNLMFINRPIIRRYTRWIFNDFEFVVMQPLVLVFFQVLGMEISVTAL
jgi:hypothetical protein